MEKPFRKYNFFLDLKNSPQLLQLLTDYINQLGGKIDSFLSRNVKYVVTNRPKTEWPQKSIQSPISCQSPTPNILNNANSASFSRGKMLLFKTAQMSKTSDSLELARNMNIKIILATEMLEFCKKHLKSFDENSKPSLQQNRHLAPPFIKVLDNSLKYKINFKELNEWPELNLDFQPELCPFFKKKEVPPNASQQSNKSTALNRLNEKCTMLTTPILNMQTPNATNRSISKSVQTKRNVKRKHTTFCEICHKEYNDFESHLTDETHSKFMNNEENFQELISVINSLPPFIKQPTFKSKDRRSTDGGKDRSFTDVTNHQQQQQQLAEKETLALQSKSASPTMRSIHSINTVWSSASKSRSFVAIHDLINKNDELMTVEENDENSHPAKSSEIAIDMNDFL